MHNAEGERKIDFALQIGERHRLRRSHTRIDSAIDPRFGQPPHQLGCGSFRFFNLILIPRIEEHLRWMREPYDSPFFLTIFRGPRRLGWGKEADGTISGT